MDSNRQGSQVFKKKKDSGSQALVVTPVISAAWEAEIRRIVV
jgi:hypothetical protein